jgi:hypothetical protein
VDQVVDLEDLLALDLLVEDADTLVSPMKHWMQWMEWMMERMTEWMIYMNFMKACKPILWRVVHTFLHDPVHLPYHPTGADVHLRAVEEDGNHREA